jgi:hypothetical protein
VPVGGDGSADLATVDEIPLELDAYVLETRRNHPADAWRRARVRRECATGRRTP